MHLAPRFVSRRLSRRQRRMYGIVTLYFVAVAVAMTWPVYAWVARTHPLVLGMPLSMAWLGALLVLSFLVGWGLYRWEDRQGLFDDEDRR